jgi:hypothetical protein
VSKFLNILIKNEKITEKKLNQYLKLYFEDSFEKEGKESFIILLEIFKILYSDNLNNYENFLRVNFFFY